MIRGFATWSPSLSRKPRVCGDDPTVLPDGVALNSKPRVCGDDPGVPGPSEVFNSKPRVCGDDPVFAKIMDIGGL